MTIATRASKPASMLPPFCESRWRAPVAPCNFPRMPPTIADRLGSALAGRYVLERELGAGGMATVWLARDLRHDRSVALKVLRPELTAVPVRLGIRRTTAPRYACWVVRAKPRSRMSSPIRSVSVCIGTSVRGKQGPAPAT